MSSAPRQECAFAAYLQLGPERSLAALAQTLRSNPAAAGLARAPSLRTIEGWSARYLWQHRLAELERKEREELERQHLDWVRQYRERLRQEGLLLQQRGIEWLKEKETKRVSAGEAVRAIEAGFKLEALSLGEVTERIALEEEQDERLHELSDEDLELVIGFVRRAATEGPEGTGAAPSQ